MPSIQERFFTPQNTPGTGSDKCLPMPDFDLTSLYPHNHGSGSSSMNTNPIAKALEEAERLCDRLHRNFYGKPEFPTVDDLQNLKAAIDKLKGVEKEWANHYTEKRGALTARDFGFGDT